MHGIEQEKQGSSSIARMGVHKRMLEGHCEERHCFSVNGVVVRNHRRDTKSCFLETPDNSVDEDKKVHGVYFASGQDVYYIFVFRHDATNHKSKR